MFFIIIYQTYSVFKKIKMQLTTYVGCYLILSQTFCIHTLFRNFYKCINTTCCNFTSICKLLNSYEEQFLQNLPLFYVQTAMNYS